MLYCFLFAITCVFFYCNLHKTLSVYEQIKENLNVCERQLNKNLMISVVHTICTNLSVFFKQFLSRFRAVLRGNNFITQDFDHTKNF